MLLDAQLDRACWRRRRGHRVGARRADEQLARGQYGDRSVGSLGGLQVDERAELLHQFVALVAQIVGRQTGPLGLRDPLVQRGDLASQGVDLLHLGEDVQHRVRARRIEVPGEPLHFGREIDGGLDGALLERGIDGVRRQLREARIEPLQRRRQTRIPGRAEQRLDLAQAVGARAGATQRRLLRDDPLVEQVVHRAPDLLDVDAVADRDAAQRQRR